jgi:hypothetical protein
MINLMSGGVTHFYTSYLFPDSGAPRYYVGGSVLTIAIFFCGLMAVTIRFYLSRLNRKLEMSGGNIEANAKKAFRYAL